MIWQIPFEFGKYPVFVRISLEKYRRKPSHFGDRRHHIGPKGSACILKICCAILIAAPATVCKIRSRQKGSNWLERTLFGWHHMYDRFGEVSDDVLFEEVCVTSRTARIRFDPAMFYDHFLVERISGVGLDRLPPRNWTRHVPQFALPFFRLSKRLLDRVLR
jgi:hypothetical protein